MSINIYPSIAKVKRNGVYENLPGFVQQSGNADIEAMIATKESDTLAQYSHPQGSYFILNDVLYQADIDIPVSGTIAVGTNCHVAVLGNDVAKTKSDVKDLKSAISDITASTSNICTSALGRYTISASGVVSPVTGAAAVNYIGSEEPFPCVAETAYVLSVDNYGQDKLAGIYIFFYDSNKAYITASNVAKYNVVRSTTFNSPANAAYIAFYAYHASGLLATTNVMVEAGSTPSASYIPPYSAYDQQARTYVQNLAVVIQKNAEKTYNKFGRYLLDCFEIGNIVFSDNGLTYGTGSGPTRVRTKQHFLFRLNKGDVIGLSDYTDAIYSYAWYDDENEFHYSSWTGNDVTLTDNGYYAILIRNRTEVDQTTSDNLASLFFGYSFTEYKTQDKYIDYDKIVKNVNHRGFNTIAPENTLPAYQLSKINGFNYAETDVSFTSDGVAVCLHDSTINRTARNPDGTPIANTLNISDITYAQALEYDFGIWKNAIYAGTKIPTLEQFLVLCKNIGINPYVEIKTTETYTEAQIHSLMDLAKNIGMYDRVTWISFLPTYLRYVSSYDQNAKIIYVVGEITDTVISNAKSLKANGNLLGIMAQNSVLTSAGIEKCINNNLPLEVWTVDSESGVFALDPYITGVSSDNLIAGKVLYERNIYRTDLYT